MRILHTADWHIGRTLYGKKRYDETSAFLDWLVDTIREHDVEVLLIAGDIFDTTTPSNRAQALYYEVLPRVAAAGCRHVVVTAGNHDSPSFLTAPRDLLKALNVHVIGNASSDPADEVIVLTDPQGHSELIVCAVPYLRDRDIRVVEAGESIEAKEHKLLAGIREHYAEVGEYAERIREELIPPVPIVGMGHLFTAGGQTVTGDGVRELYVGSLAHVTSSVFPTCFSYTALGHLHVPQKVGGSDVIRYSGSPIPMGFGEAGQTKTVCLLEYDADAATSAATYTVESPSVHSISIPVFQTIAEITGDWKHISTRIQEYAQQQTSVWLEITYSGSEITGDLRDRLEQAIAGTQLEILRVRNTRITERVLGSMREDERLEELDVHEVFERCMSVHGVPDDQQAELRMLYQTAVRSLDEMDARAE